MTKFKFVWFDDEKKGQQDLIRSVSKWFKERYYCDLEFIPFNKQAPFLHYLRTNRDFIDFIFLDIRIENSQRTGIDVYFDVRKICKEVPLAFVSAYLSSSIYEDKIAILKGNDKCLYLIKNSIPSTIARGGEAYYDHPVSPIIEMINDKMKYFNFSYLDFLRLNIRERRKFFTSASKFNVNFAREYFNKNKDVDWLVIGGGHQKILKHGQSTLATNELIQMSEETGKVLFGYQRDQEIADYLIDMYTHQKRPRSVETIIAKILEFDKTHVILKCLLDPESQSFQIREFDIEPFKGVIDLNTNHIVEMWIITYPGERRFVFKNGDQGLQNRFKMEVTPTTTHELLLENL